MIQREFFAALEQERNGWEIRSAEIRRGYGWQVVCCPITAVAMKVTGNYYGTGDFPKAAEDIGLPAEFALDIANAADAQNFKPRLRKRILTALGLSE